MSVMSEMSRAIREQIERNSPSKTLQGLSHDTLVAFVQIVGALYADLKAELDRRNGET